MADNCSHVFVGSEVGFLKGINLNKQTFSNLNPNASLTKEDEITAMYWKDFSEKEMWIGHRNQNIQVYNSEKHCLTSFHNMQVGEGPIRGICQYDGHIVTAVESGIVRLWNDKENIDINTGDNLCKMSTNLQKPLLIGTGGEENDLKIWDLQKPQVPIFKAKNVKNDFLDLRVPIWIMDLKFRPDEKVVTCTRHSQIRLYDPKAQKRPVIDMQFERYPLMCLSLSHNEHQVVVGSSRGRMALVDLRKKLLIHVFKGFAGSIRCIQCHPTLPFVASCGLDRFLRIHDLNQHKLLKKMYLKTRLNCLLLKTEGTGMADLKSGACEKEPDKKDIIDEEEENIWENMAIIKDKTKKKSLDENVTESKSYKKQKRQMASNHMEESI